MENTKAFPDPMRGTEESVINQEPHELDQGMDLRDYFAAKAMQAGMTNSHLNVLQEIEGSTLEELAEDAYRMADAMMKARKP